MCLFLLKGIFQKRATITVYSVCFTHCSVENIWSNIFPISYASIHRACPFPAIPLLVPTCQSQSLITPLQFSDSVIYSPWLPKQIQDPAFCACPAPHSYLPPLPSTLHVLQSLSLHTVLPFPPSPSSTLIQSPFCLLSTSILQNLTIKTNPYPANKLKTKAVP